jgi:antitoxin component of RelBE/YafQ-DinJ toxin-antitoxin module
MKKTIAIDEKLCEEAKEYAKTTGRTFSGLIEISLKKILKKEEKVKDGL